MALSEDKKRLSIESGSGITPWEVAQCIGDYRTTKLGRDVGLLCCSPKVNRASIRRPFNVGRFVKAEEMEAVMQLKDYGFSTLKTNSKLSVGSGTTSAFINQIVAQSKEINLWTPTSPDQSDIPGLWQFDGYNHGARFIGQDDIVQGLEATYRIAVGREMGTIEIPQIDEGNYTLPTNCEVMQCAINDKIKVRFTWTHSQYTGSSRFIISGDIFPRYSGTSFGADGQTHSFSIDTNGHNVGESWTDTSGNTIELRADAGGMWYVDLYLSRIFLPDVTNETIHNLDYRLQYIRNNSTRSGTALPIKATIISNGTSNFKPANTLTSDVGFYYKQNDTWYQSEWNEAKQGKRTPYQHIFTDNGVNGTTGIFIVIAKNNYADEVAIVNPQYEMGVNSLHGYVLYNNLGFSQNCLDTLKSVSVIQCHGDASFINGQYKNMSSADNTRLIVAPEGYRLMYDSSQS